MCDASARLSCASPPPDRRPLGIGSCWREERDTGSTSGDRAAFREDTRCASAANAAAVSWAIEDASDDVEASTAPALPSTFERCVRLFACGAPPSCRGSRPLACCVPPGTSLASVVTSGTPGPSSPPRRSSPTDVSATASATVSLPPPALAPGSCTSPPSKVRWCSMSLRNLASRARSLATSRDICSRRRRSSFSSSNSAAATDCRFLSSSISSSSRRDASSRARRFSASTSGCSSSTCLRYRIFC
mmetsp:Transcript_21400/g.52873  ORF Transcript_21400/g.52873 Transcript_21400/m.52873 type:complete len:246 (-) Transcript_21400:372-1109(-)